MNKTIYISISLWLCTVAHAFAQFDTPDCDALLVTDITVTHDTADWMNITISYPSGHSFDTVFYSNIIVTRIVAPFDIIADLSCGSTISKSLYHTTTIGIYSYEGTVPEYGTYRISMPGVCDSIRVSSTVGLSEHNIDHLTVIYPNPTKDKIEIETDFEFEYEIKIEDIRGGIVYKAINTGKSNSVGMADLTSGIYFITLSDKHGWTITKKIIKE